MWIKGDSGEKLKSLMVPVGETSTCLQSQAVHSSHLGGRHGRRAWITQRGTLFVPRKE